MMFRPYRTRFSLGALARRPALRFNINAVLLVAGLIATWPRPTARAADAPASPAAQQPADTLASQPAAEPRVTLLQAGAEPHKLLRLQPKAGAQQTSTMTMKMTMEMQMGAGDAQPIKMPPMKFVMETTPTSVSPQGDLTYESVITDATVGDDPDAMPQVAEAMKDAITSLKTLKVTGRMSTRGINKGVEAKLPEGVSPQSRQMMEQMKDAFSNTGMALPKEAIGPGAKWEVKQFLKSQGMKLDQTTVYELVSVKGDQLTAKSTVTQTAARQQIANPAMPGMKTDLIKLQSKGTGDLTISLTQLLPLLATIQMHNETVMGLDINGQQSEMAMKMEMNMRLETK